MSCATRNRQSTDNQWSHQRREEAERENREHERQMEQWKAQMKAAGLLESPVPHGPPAKGVRIQSPRHELFHKSMQLFVRMIQHQKLHLPSQHFQRKPLQHQGEVRQQSSTEQKSLQGLLRLKANHKLYSSYQQPLQQLQHTHLVHLSQPFLNQSKNLRHQRTWKHPLPQPAQQGPPNKQARSKEFPRGPHGNRSILLLQCRYLQQLILRM